MTRIYLIAAIYCARHGDKPGAVRLAQMALIWANKEGHRQSAGHIMSALNRVRS